MGYKATATILLGAFCVLFENTKVSSLDLFNHIQHPPRPHRHHHEEHNTPGFHIETKEIPIVNTDTDEPYVYPSGLTFGNNITAGWFVNWAQYRKSPYDFWPSNISSIIPKLDMLFYGFYFFCPNASMFQPYWADGKDARAPYCKDPNTDGFTVTPIDPKDDPTQGTTFISEIRTLANNLNSDMKIIMSIGGWNFPSNFFSQMVSDVTSRTTFINSLVTIMGQLGVDGVDFDWEYPGSKPRMDPVEITRSIFKFVNDTGGTDADYTNFVLLVKELRSNAAMNGKIITLCGQTGLMNVDHGFDVQNLTKYVDFINIMTYDYFVSAINDSVGNATAPNQPVRAPNTDRINNWNITGSLVGYIERGAPPQQLLVGIASYGHMWYLPGCDVYNETCWAQMGLWTTYPGVNNSRCANVTAASWAGSAGLYTLQCGFYGIYEIQNAGFFNTEVVDPYTLNSMSYIDAPGADDGWTPKGTWVTWLGKPGISAVIELAKDLGIPGAFEFDLSTDAHDDGKWTFEYFNHMATCIKSDTC